MKLKSCLTSCLSRVIITFFLLFMVPIALSPYLLERMGNSDIKHWLQRAHRWKVDMGEYLRKR